jgi:tRNA (guanine37-N1)-methyltransferase
MRFDIITAHPDSLASYLGSSMLKRAQEKNRVDIRVHDLRDFTKNKHKKIDDKPYGGGAGMVLQVEPIFRAVKRIKARERKSTRAKKKVKVLVTSPRGKEFTQRTAEQFTKLDQLILICGHYEGIDERVMKFADGMISTGPYVLTGGELPALTIVDAVTRLLPGVLGNPASLAEESYSLSRSSSTNYKLQTTRSKEYPHYSRPEKFEHTKGKHWIVPKVLLSGDHAKIEKWRLTKTK